MKVAKNYQNSSHLSPGKTVFGLLILCLCMIQPGSATIFSQDGSEIAGAHLIETMNNATNVSTTPFPIQFFYNTHCGSCQAAIQYLDTFSANHTDIGVEHHDLFNNTESFALYEGYKKRFNRTDIHYPIIFMGNVAIMESGDIQTYTEPLTLWYQTNAKKDPVTGLVSWITSFTKENK
nr:hypothetical protein [uncultured Methanospirillum sp.]